MFASSTVEVVNEITRLRLLIDSESELIGRVKRVRDQAYAHYDPERVKFAPSLLDYQRLVDLSSEIYNSLNLKLFESTVLFKHTVPWEIDPVIRLSAKRLTDIKEMRRKKE